MYVTVADVSKLIADEIAAVGAGWFAQPQNNPHGLDLRRCLVQPTRVRCTDAFERGKQFDAWLVLEERPDSEDGYRIIFDEASGRFGLACGTRSDLVFIGFSGSFLNTVQGM